MKLLLKLIFIVVLFQTVGCGSTHVVLHDKNKPENEIVTLYVPQRIVHSINGKTVSGVLEFEDEHLVQLLYLNEGKTALQGTVHTNYKDNYTNYTYTNWDFDIDIKFEQGNTYMFYFEEIEKKPYMHLRNLGPLGKSFSPVLTELGFVEGGRAASIKKT